MLVEPLVKSLVKSLVKPCRLRVASWSSRQSGPSLLLSCARDKSLALGKNLSAEPIPRLCVSRKQSEAARRSGAKAHPSSELSDASGASLGPAACAGLLTI